MGFQQACSIMFLVIIFATVFLLPLILLLGEDVGQLERQYQDDDRTASQPNVLLDQTFQSSVNQSRQSSEPRKKIYECPNIYEFPCYKSFDGITDVMCLNREHHCDKKKDCLNGEDEDDCDDIYGALEKQQNLAAIKLKLLNETRRFDNNFIHNNCTLWELVNGKCPCDLTHTHTIVCQNHAFNQIPDNLSLSIAVLNLDGGNITEIDSQILNKYRNLTTLSLKRNRLTYIHEDTFSSLTSLKKLYLIGNQIRHISENAFHSLNNLKFLELHENQLERFDGSKLLKGLAKLETLYLADNQIKELGTFPGLDSLRWIDLSNNQLEYIQGIFRNLPQLEFLNLSNNRLKKLPGNASQFTIRLIDLDLSMNFIDSLEPLTFHGLFKLEKLNLSYNPLETLPKRLFEDLHFLRSLDLSQVKIHNIHPDHFAHLRRLKHAYFSQFRYCMYVPYVRICRPYSDGVSSLQHLLLYPVIRLFVWVVAGITCFGNSLVLLWRSMAKKEHQALSLLVKNLAIADLMMGVYLVIIGSYDQIFRDQYNNHALKWMNSWQCNFCGFLATLSSELSIFIVLMITIERYRSITMTCRLVTFRWTTSILLVIWLVSLGTSLFPMIYWSNPEDPLYYASNGVCFPLHLEDPFMFGWQFSTFIFLGINFPAVVVIISLYSRLFLIIKHDRKLTRPALLGKAEHEDVVLAFRFFCIVVTDCLCWLPIVIIKVLSFTSVFISPKVYAWLVVFILPINSALNPMIYTIAAPTEFRRKLNKYLRQARRNIGPILGVTFDRHLREPVSSTTSSHVTGSFDRTRSSNCSDLSMVNINCIGQMGNGLTASAAATVNHDRSQIV